MLKICFYPAQMVYFFIFLCTSCASTQKVLYFNNIQNKEFEDEDIIPLIQKSDILNITVSSLNPDATLIFNQPNLSGNNQLMTGYLVNSEGNIIFPVLGKIKVAGLTQKNLADDLTQLLVKKKLLVDPIISVRVVNFKVTILGEVARPTVVPVPNEKISMLEALGIAGDMTLYAQRDNVLLIRVENGKKITRRININSPDFLTSPYYYLKTNDVVYVEPNKTKVASTTRTQQLLPTIFSALSLVIIIITQLLLR